MEEGRWVLLIASDAGDTDSVSDRAMERLVDAISKEGYEVVRTSTPEDGLSLVKCDPSHSAILLDWDLPGEHQFDERAALKIIRAVRRRNKKVPIFLIADRTLVSELPLEVVKQVHEYIHLFGDTPAFIANRVDFAVERYHEQLLPPYFRELKKYNGPGRVFVGRAGTYGRRGLSEASGGHGVPPLLRRKPDAVGPGDFDGAAGIVAGPHWASGRVGAQRGAHLWRGLDFLCAERLVDLEPDCRAWGDRQRRYCAGRRELPQVDLPFADDYGCSAGVLQADTQWLRHDRPGAAAALQPGIRFAELIEKSPFSAGAASQEPTYAVVTNSTYDGLCYDVDRVVTELAQERAAHPL